MGGKSSSKSKSGFAQNWAQPFGVQGMKDVQSVYNANQGGLQDLTNLAQQKAVPAIYGKFEAGLGGANMARNYNMDIVGGKYMEGNPYLQQMIDRSRADIMDDVGSRFALSGRYGSGAHQDLLTRGLADMETQYRFGNYAQEMARRDAAAGALQEGNAQDFGLTLGGIGVGAETPYVGMNAMANSLNALSSGGRDKNKQSQGLGGAILGGLGGIASAAVTKYSDRRMKRDIVKLGTRKDGLNVYEWAYKIEPTVRHRGFMADEVKEIYPDAYIENYQGSGYAGVNYGLIPHEAML